MSNNANDNVTLIVEAKFRPNDSPPFNIDFQMLGLPSIRAMRLKTDQENKEEKTKIK